MSYIEGINREQILLFPEKVDDYIEEENIVRFIDAFIERQDLVKHGFKHAHNKQGPGRNPYNPKDLLKLWVYGYLNYIRSSRKLEKETHRNIEVMWLMRKLKPDHKTISDFRSNNCQALKEVFKEFGILCDRLGLFNEKIVAIDGSKFKANNSIDNCISQNILKKRIKRLEEEIEQYLEETENNDKLEQSASLKRKHTQKLKYYNKKMEEYQKEYQHLKENGLTQITTTDPESRLIGDQVSYNIQTAVSEKHKLIVDFDVTNDINDLQQLSHIAIMAKETLNVDCLQVIADKGYYSNIEIVECLKNNITPYVYKQKPSHKNQGYLKENFAYNPIKNIYTCPEGKELSFMRRIKYPNGSTNYQYQGRECKKCPVKDKCTKSKRGRIIERYEKEAIVQENFLYTQKNKEMFKKRKGTAEGPFGVIKYGFGFPHQLLRGKEKVKAEFSLTCLAYNIKRAIEIVGIRGLIEAILLLFYVFNKFIKTNFNSKGNFQYFSCSTC